MSPLVADYLRITAFIALPIGLGAALERFGVERRRSRQLFNFAFYGCQTSAAVLSIWIARLDGAARLLPVLTLAGWLVSALLAWLLSQALRHPARARGAFIACLSMSNNGFTMLGFVALALFGEAGLAQAAYAQLLYTPFFLLFCFPIGRHYGSTEPGLSLSGMLLKNALDPRVWLPLVAMAVGLALNFTHVPRPAVAAALTRGLIYTGTIASSVAIGLLMSGFRLRRYWRENVASFAHRSTLFPLFYFALAKLFGLDALDTKILVLYGLVPSALLANLLAALFELDIELTLSVFIVSTGLFLALVLPLFALATRL